MKKLFRFSLFAIAAFAFSSRASVDSVLTITIHDTVFIDRLIINDQNAVKRMTEPFENKVSLAKKIGGWGMILSGLCMGVFSVQNFLEPTPRWRTYDNAFIDEYQGYLLRKNLRKTGFYEINICLSAGLIAAGASMLFK